MKKMKINRRGFSLVELLVALSIFAILGGVAVTALNLMLTSFRHTDDQITARSEIEFALNTLRPQFTNIALGMPNSKVGTSFATGFVGLVNVGSFTTFSGGVSMTAPVQPISGDKELLYAWAVPTDVLVTSRHEISPDIVPASLDVVSADFHLLGEKGFTASANRSNPNSWALFPALRIPVHIHSVSSPLWQLYADVNPGPGGSLPNYSEVHLLRIARLYVENNLLKQKIYRNGTNDEVKILATNISSVSFEFDDVSRLLTMMITAHGNYPSEKRELKERVTWRIRN